MDQQLVICQVTDNIDDQISDTNRDILSTSSRILVARNITWDNKFKCNPIYIILSEDLLTKETHKGA